MILSLKYGTQKIRLLVYYTVFSKFDCTIIIKIICYVGCEDESCSMMYVCMYVCMCVCVYEEEGTLVGKTVILFIPCIVSVIIHLHHHLHVTN